MALSIRGHRTWRLFHHHAAENETSATVIYTLLCFLMWDVKCCRRWWSRAGKTGHNQEQETDPDVCGNEWYSNPSTILSFSIYFFWGILLFSQFIYKVSNKLVLEEHLCLDISTQTREGDTINCVDIDKQPALDHPLLKNHKVQVNIRIMMSHFPTIVI